MYKEIIKIAGMGSWGNYMASHYLSGTPIKELHIDERKIPRLIKQAEDYEKYCASVMTNGIKKYGSINEIDSDMQEGKLLLAAIAIITTECRTDKSPDEILLELQGLRTRMFSEDAL